MQHARGRFFMRPRLRQDGLLMGCRAAPDIVSVGRMVRLQIISSALRHYAEKDPGPFAAFNVSCTVIHDPDGCIWLSGMSLGADGGFNRAVMRDIAAYCLANGIHTVKALRVPGHRLPRGHVVGNHVEMYPREFV